MASDSMLVSRWYFINGYISFIQERVILAKRVLDTFHDLVPIPPGVLNPAQSDPAQEAAHNVKSPVSLALTMPKLLRA